MGWGGAGRGGGVVSTDVVSMLISVFFSFLQNIHLKAAMALPLRVKVHIPVLFKCIDPQRLSLKREGPFQFMQSQLWPIGVASLYTFPTITSHTQFSFFVFLTTCFVQFATEPPVGEE